MRTILHLALTDLRRVRWAACAWGAVYLGIPGLEEYHAHTFEVPFDEAGRSTAGPAQAIFLVRTFLEPLLAWLVAALVVQGDPVLDGRAFWRTRPIAPSTLLVGKATALALLLIGLPVLVSAARFATYGIPAASLVAMSLQLAVSRAAWMAIGAVLAALTGTLTRLVLVLIALVGVLVATLSIVLPMLLSWRGRDGAGGVGSVSAGFWGWGPGTGEGLPVFGLTLLFTAVAAAVLYARRARSLAIGLLAGAVVLPAPLVGDGGTPASAHPLNDRVRSAVQHAGALQTIGIGPGRQKHPSSTTNVPSLRVDARFVLPQLPANYTADLPQPETVLRLANGATLRGTGRPVSSMFEFAAQAAAARLTPCAGREHAPSCTRELYLTLLDLGEVERATIERHSGQLSVTGTLHVAEHRAVGVLPLRSGVALRRPGYLLEVLSVLQQRSGLALAGRFTRFPTLAATPTPQVELFVRRGNVGSIVATPPAGLPGSLTLRWPSHWHVHPRTWGADVQEVFSASHGLQRVPYPMTPALDWSTDVELVVVESTYIGSTPVQWAAANVRIVRTNAAQPPAR